MPKKPLKQTAESILYDMLCAHEGGGPSITIGYDDATFNYVTERKLRFGSDQKVSGWGKSILTAMVCLSEEVARALAKEQPYKHGVDGPDDPKGHANR